MRICEEKIVQIYAIILAIHSRMFGRLVILLGCIFVGLFLGLSGFTSYDGDPVRLSPTCEAIGP